MNKETIESDFPSQEWLKDAQDMIEEGLKLAARNIYDKYKNESQFPFLTPIVASEEWLTDAIKEINLGLSQAAKNMLEKYEHDVHFLMFLHIALCESLCNVYRCAPDTKEAKRFIAQAIKEVEERYDPK